MPHQLPLRALGQAVVLAAVAAACGGGSTVAGPSTTSLSPVEANADWSVSTPGAQGLRSDLLIDLVNRIRRGEYGAVTSLLIARHEKLVLEEYFDGWTADRTHTTQSVSKSVTSLLAGMAVDRGLLSIDAPVTSFFPEYAPIANLDDRKRAMTVRHLLMMQTGLDWSEATYEGSPLERMNTCGCNWLRFVLDWPMREPPGTRWEYVSGGTIVLGAIVASVVGQPLYQFAHEQLDAPLAIRDSRWVVSSLENGITHAGGGLRLRPRDMLKIGQLVLNGGNWRGVQVVSDRWIRESTTPLITNVTTFGSWPASYGYLWWRLPDGVIAAVGSRGQWIFIVQSANLVVSATGEVDANFLSAPTALYRHVLPSLDR
jgi:CubicO group peptidase (beta-lactamase class C family)